MKSFKKNRYFIHPILAILITAIPIPLLITSGFVFHHSRRELPDGWIIGALCMFLFIYAITFVVASILASISSNLLALIHKFNKKNSCLAGGLMAAMAYIPVYGVNRMEDILMSPSLYITMLNGVFGGWLFWRLWERAGR